MAIGVLIEVLLGGPCVSTTTSESSTTSDKKGGAWEWIKNKLKALLQLLGKQEVPRSIMGRRATGL